VRLHGQGERRMSSREFTSARHRQARSISSMPDACTIRQGSRAHRQERQGGNSWCAPSLAPTLFQTLPCPSGRNDLDLRPRKPLSTGKRAGGSVSSPFDRVITTVETVIERSGESARGGRDLLGCSSLLASRCPVIREESNQMWGLRRRK